MLIIGALVVTSIAMTHNQRQNLCGREYMSTQNLEEVLRNEAGTKEFKSDKGVVVFLDANRHTLWWLSDYAGRRSIVTCKTKIEANGGYADSAVEADCGQDRSGRCVAQVQAMARAKF